MGEITVRLPIPGPGTGIAQDAGDGLVGKPVYVHRGGDTYLATVTAVTVDDDGLIVGLIVGYEVSEEPLSLMRADVGECGYSFGPDGSGLALRRVEIPATPWQRGGYIVCDGAGPRTKRRPVMRRTTLAEDAVDGVVARQF